MNCIDLFSGCGGLTQGFVQAGFNVLYANDHWDKATETYAANYDHPVQCGDIRKIKCEDVRATIGGKNVDVIFGGPPCQGFSMAGRRDKKDPRNSLFMEFIRFVKDFQPKYFVMENVPGILSMKTQSGEKVIDIIMQEFDKAGYRVKYQKLYAPNYGVPQGRRRVIFIGCPKSSDTVITFPPKRVERKDYVPVSDVLTPRNEVDPKYFCSQKAIDGFVARKKKNLAKGTGFGAQYLKMDKPSYTISARYYKDGSDALIKYSETEIRRLTELEVAAIQTFPRDYIWKGSSRDIYTQVGNAVPCQLARCIAEHINELDDTLFIQVGARSEV